MTEPAEDDISGELEAECWLLETNQALPVIDVPSSECEGAPGAGGLDSGGHRLGAFNRTAVYEAEESSYWAIGSASSYGQEQLIGPSHCLSLAYTNDGSGTAAKKADMAYDRWMLVDPSTTWSEEIDDPESLRGEKKWLHMASATAECRTCHTSTLCDECKRQQGCKESNLTCAVDQLDALVCDVPLLNHFLTGTDGEIAEACTSQENCAVDGEACSIDLPTKLACHEAAKRHELGGTRLEIVYPKGAPVAAIISCVVVVLVVGPAGAYIYIRRKREQEEVHKGAVEHHGLTEEEFEDERAAAEHQRDIEDSVHGGSTSVLLHHKSKWKKSARKILHLRSMSTLTPT